MTRGRVPTDSRCAIVIAGGRSRRMGEDKAGVRFAGEPMLARVVAAATPHVREVIVVAAADQALPALGPATRVVRDEEPDAGPLVALALGLSHVRDATEVVVLATDLPLLAPAHVEALFAELASRRAAIPLVEARPQPLCAAYRMAALAPCVSAARADGARSMRALLRELGEPGIEQLSDPGLRVSDPQLLGLRDADTAEELDALARARS